VRCFTHSPSSVVVVWSVSLSDVVLEHLERLVVIPTDTWERREKMGEGKGRRKEGVGRGGGTRREGGGEGRCSNN
jgi:hypothetical protein